MSHHIGQPMRTPSRASIQPRAPSLKVLKMLDAMVPPLAVKHPTPVLEPVKRAVANLSGQSAKVRLSTFSLLPFS